MAIELSLTGRTALVVGGGGGGIGSSVCHRLADAGADIVALSAERADLDETADAVTERGCQIHTGVVDVTDLDALRSAIEDGATELSPIDLVVNVVGGVTVEHWHRLADFPIDSFDHLLTTNLRYALISCQTVAATLIDAGRPGAMVNISSIASRGQPLLSAYGAAKAGLDSLTRSMAMEWGRHGIRVNTVAPGTVNTPRSGRSATDTNDPLAAAITLGRRGTPTDIADACVFLLSDLASYITGQTLNVDGGPSRGAVDDHDLPVMVTNPAIRARFET
ncbi:MAG: SDR family oxidoreductase [Actinomycetota bacterium]